LRSGDHAEYTLLERKNRHSKLDGSRLFATLEPCAPGARNAPKLSCAERIVLARIKEVWVGIEDPDPVVDRKGIKFLQENGVTVHIFDRDLQDIIREENKEFIEQALERAEDAVKKVKGISLSRLEGVIPRAEMKDFSEEALSQYREIAKITENIGSKSFYHRLLYQGILKEEGDKFTPTGFGLLLFGKEPRIAIPQAGLLGTIHYPNGQEETKDFDSALVLIPGQIEKWLRDKLPNVISRSQMQRQTTPIFHFELVREAVVNALVHRDYDIAGGKCQIVITEDTITVKSPGAPLSPITLEQLRSFNAPMLSRNPQLHYVFSRMELAEERGFGLKSLQTRSAELGLPLPTYSFEDPYLVLTLYLNSESAVRVLAPEVLKSLNGDEQAGWEYLASMTSTTMASYAEFMGFDSRKAQRHLKRFVELGLLRRVGSGRFTKYQVIR
jgi:ATP-dependent DNA helicase RecG